jgi:hypothetical protein
MSEQLNTITQLPLGPDAAWRRYLEQIRRADAEMYERLEQDAWDELQAALRRAEQSKPAGAA